MSASSTSITSLYSSPATMPTMPESGAIAASPIIGRPEQGPKKVMFPIEALEMRNLYGCDLPILLSQFSGKLTWDDKQIVDVDSTFAFDVDITKFLNLSRQNRWKFSATHPLSEQAKTNITTYLESDNCQINIEKASVLCIIQAKVFAHWALALNDDKKTFKQVELLKKLDQEKLFDLVTIQAIEDAEEATSVTFAETINKLELLQQAKLIDEMAKETFDCENLMNEITSADEKDIENPIMRRFVTGIRWQTASTVTDTNDE